MTVNYYHERTHIYMVCYPQIRDRCKVLIYTGVTLDQWSRKYQKVKATHKHSNEVNELLNVLKVFVEKTYIEALTNNEHLDSFTLKTKIKQRLKGVSNSEFYQYADAWIDSQKMTTANNTYRGRLSILNSIRDMYPDLKWTQITPLFVKQFKDQLYKTKGMNTVNKYLRVFKLIISTAHAEGVHNNTVYMLIGFTGKTIEADSIYLTSDEIKQLYNAMTSFDDKLRNATILFLRQCLTGLRYGSLYRLDKSMRYESDGMEMITVMTNKTNVKVSIPVSPMLARLLDMDAHLISNQKLNSYIKEACKAAGIDKWAQITSHTARRTFASNMVLAGMPTNVIMAITGHKTEGVFWKYVKLDKSLLAVKGASILSELYA